jgi:hypothetical protein
VKNRILNDDEKRTIYNFIIDGNEIQAENHYKGILSATFHQFTRERLFLVLDERLKAKEIIYTYLCCLMVSISIFFIANFQNLHAILGQIAIPLIPVSLFFLVFGDYKMYYVYMFTFDVIEKTFSKSRLRVPSKDKQVLGPTEMLLEKKGRVLAEGSITQLTCYKGNIAIEVPFSLFLITDKGSKVKVCNTISMAQVLDYGNVLSKILDVPLKREKYGF